MRRIKIFRDVIIDTNETVVSMSPSDYRKLLAVARAAQPFLNEMSEGDMNGAVADLIIAVRRLNKPAKGVKP